MGDGHPRADAGAQQLLADTEGIQHGVVMRGRQLANADQVVDQFDNGSPVVVRLHIEEDLFCT